MEEDERRLYDCGKVVAVVKETVDVDSGGNDYVVELGEVRNRGFLMSSLRLLGRDYCVLGRILGDRAALRTTARFRRDLADHARATGYRSCVRGP